MNRFLASISVFLGLAAPVTAQLAIMQTIDVGAAPHGMLIEGNTAYVALSGADEIAVVDLSKGEVTDRWAVPGSPLDIIRSGDGFLVSAFRGDRLFKLDEKGRSVADSYVDTGPSLFAYPSTEEITVITSEFADRLSVIELATGKSLKRFATGDRPYPASLTRDGSRAFVPNREDGTVSIFDLAENRRLDDVAVCDQPEGGTLSIDEKIFWIACGGEDLLVGLNTSALTVESRISGVGPRPFSAAPSPDGRFLVVNNAGGETLSVVDLASNQIVQQVTVGGQPIVVRFFDKTFAVSNEVSGTLMIGQVTSARN